MWSRESFSDTHVVYSQYLLIFAVLLLVSLLLQHNIKGWPLPQAIVPILVGTTVSLCINIGGGYTHISESSVSASQDEGDTTLFDASILELDSSVFFFVLLPPIIFSSGYHLKRRLLYKNLGAICSLAFLGTLISVVTMTASLVWLQSKDFFRPALGELSTMELLSFSALISSTDPVAALAVFTELKVHPQLFYLILGESLLNDAVAVSVFKSASKFVGLDPAPDLISVAHLILTDFVVTLVLSILLGYLCGLCGALTFKRLRSLEEKHSVVSVSLVMIMVWLPFFLAEAVQLSGIVAILFTGITTRRYTVKNMNMVASIRASFALNLVAHCAETATFLLLGLSVCGLRWSQAFCFKFVSWALLCITVSRALGVYPLLALSNVYRSVTQQKVRAKVGSGYVEPDVENPYPCNTVGVLCGGTSPATMTTMHHIQKNSHHERKHLEQSAGGDHVNTQDGGAICKANSTIPLNSMTMVFISGLRGAVSFACANIFNNSSGNKSTILTATTIIILFTLLVQGCLTTPMVRLLDIPTHISQKEVKDMSERNQEPDLEELFLYPLILKDAERHVRRPKQISTLTTPVSSARPRSSGGGSINHDLTMSPGAALGFSPVQHEHRKCHRLEKRLLRKAAREWRSEPTSTLTSTESPHMTPRTKNSTPFAHLYLHGLQLGASSTSDDGCSTDLSSDEDDDEEEVHPRGRKNTGSSYDYSDSDASRSVWDTPPHYADNRSLSTSLCSYFTGSTSGGRWQELGPKRGACSFVELHLGPRVEAGANGGVESDSDGEHEELHTPTGTRARVFNGGVYASC